MSNNNPRQVLRISGLKLSLDEEALEDKLLRQQVSLILGVTANQIIAMHIHKKSLDARANNEPFFCYSVDVDVVGASRQRIEQAANRRTHSIQKLPNNPPTPNKIPPLNMALPTERLRLPPLVIGAGPAGLFAALALAEAGYKPLLIEQGQPVEQRSRDVALFWQKGLLNEASNVQFGEGGAGAFSDGKLTFRKHDPLAQRILKTLVELGAPPSVTYWHKPHLGSDKLRELIPRLRNRIEQAGGRILFCTRLSDITLSLQDSRRAVEGLVLSGAYTGTLPAQAVILAPGNGARATFSMLAGLGVALCAKPFAIGLRIEHNQALIDAAQYGVYAGHLALPSADYQLKYHTTSGRGFYSFCMCPGGWIVNAASEKGALVTNGLSLAARASGRANSALVGAVKPGEDFPDDPLAAVAWQQSIEQRAYTAGGGDYALPVCMVEDYLNCAAPQMPPLEFQPLSTAIKPANLRGLLPEQLTEGLAAALKYWQRQIKGFAEQAVLAAPESRTSSPLRILRKADGQSLNITGLYPAGEGAGYAGGILSSACDGLRSAAALCEHYAAPREDVAEQFISRLQES